MRHYLYISNVKLDMYYEQIPPKLREKIAVDLKIDLKILAATIRKQASTESRYQKLQLVEQYLRNNEKVGSIKEPATWFAGTESMKYGTISSGSKERGDLVLFGAKLPTSYIATNFESTNFECCLGLVGSRHHIVGFNEGNRVSATWSGGSVALGMVIEHLGQALAHKLDDPDNEYQGRHRVAESSTPAGSESDFDDTLQVVIKSVGNVENEGTPERLEFLAKTLTAGEHMWNGKTRWVVFGTPLYVAKAD
jgi:hypothetical protein